MTDADRTPAFLAVCGHTNIDVQLKVQDLPAPGQSSPVLDRRIVHGGTAANIARHAAGLGVPTRLWSRVGDDLPRDWEEAMHADGIDTTFLDKVTGGRTPTCYVLTDLVDQQAYCMDQGPMAEMAAAPPGEALLEDLTGWLHLATGDPDAYMAISERARDQDIRVALDPGQELRFMYDAKKFERLLDRADALFVNEEELRVACDFIGYGDAVQFLDHVDLVVVTQGAKGANLFQDGKRTRQDAFPVDAVDPTGAGDALRSGWYAALHAGKDLETALRWGQAAAAVCVQHSGPQDHVVRREEHGRVLQQAA